MQHGQYVKIRMLMVIDGSVKFIDPSVEVSSESAITSQTFSWTVSVGMSLVAGSCTDWTQHFNGLVSSAKSDGY